MLGSVSLTSHFDVTMKKLPRMVLNLIIHHSHADTDTAHRASSSSQRPASEQPEPPSAHPRTPPAAIHPPSAQRPASERASAPGQPVHQASQCRRLHQHQARPSAHATQFLLDRAGSILRRYHTTASRRFLPVAAFSQTPTGLTPTHAYVCCSSYTITK